MQIAAGCKYKDIWTRCLTRPELISTTDIWLHNPTAITPADATPPTGTLESCQMAQVGTRESHWNLRVGDHMCTTPMVFSLSRPAHVNPVRKCGQPEHACSTATGVSHGKQGFPHSTSVPQEHVLWIVQPYFSMSLKCMKRYCCPPPYGIFMSRRCKAWYCGYSTS